MLIISVYYQATHNVKPEKKTPLKALQMPSHLLEEEMEKY